MKLSIESTNHMTTIEVPGGGSVPARIWEGHTESGIPVVCLITRVAVHKEHDTAQFERELAEQRAPSQAGIEAIPLRLIL